VTILFVNRYFYPDHSATSQILTDLAFRCAEWGFDVKVVTSRQRYDDPKALLPEFETVKGVTISRVGSTGFGRNRIGGRMIDYAAFLWKARRHVKRLVNSGTVVVTKTDPPMLGMFLGPLVGRRGGVLINWLQDLFPEVLIAVNGGRVVNVLCGPLRIMRNQSLGRAGANVVIGRSMAKYLVSSGVPEERVRLVHNWPFERDEKPGNFGDELRKETGLDDSFVVGYFGNLGRVHEYETILGAICSLSPERKVRFLFIGGGVLMDELEQRVAELGLDNFQRRGYVEREDLPQALSSVDVHLVTLNPALERFVVPSKFAGVAASGRPVLYVGDPKGELGGLVTKWQCGYAMRPGESELLAARIRELARDAGAVERMGLNARRLYEREYRADALMNKWRELLTEIGDLRPRIRVNRDYRNGRVS